MDCVFCKIAAKQIPADIKYEDDDMLIFSDIQPKAKYHYVVIPKKHYATLAEADENEAEVLGRMLLKIPELSETLHLSSGYRLVINQGADAGQTVFHLHIHILAGQKLPF